MKNFACADRNVQNFEGEGIPVGALHIWARSSVGKTIIYRFAGFYFENSKTNWAVSSVVERKFDVFEAIGSIPVPPSLFLKIRESPE